MQKDRKYLFVTGASGFIGKNFITKAKSKGHKIFALSRFKRKAKSKNIVWIKGEIDDDFNNYLKNTHTMIHFAAAGVNNNNLNIREVFEENVFKPHKFLLSCLKNGCKKWIIIGSASEYGKSAEKKKELTVKTKELPESNYEKSKLIFSKLAFKISKNKKIKCRIMRIFNVYGKGENKKKLLTSLKFSIKKKKKFTINSSNQKKDFIDINNVTDILIDTLNFKKNSKKFPQIWHIASGNPMTVKDFVISKVNKKVVKKLEFKNKNKIIRNFISSKKSIWKI